jgi:hypothetical protein
MAKVIIVIFKTLSNVLPCIKRNRSLRLQLLNECCICVDVGHVEQKSHHPELACHFAFALDAYDHGRSFGVLMNLQLEKQLHNDSMFNQ